LKVLVTGGLGYLGSVLCRELGADGVSTRIIDTDYFNQVPQWDGHGVNLMRADIRDAPLVSKELEGVDAVVHLAAIVGDPAGNLNQEMTIEVNVASTARLAVECAKRGIRMIFASTSSVYGYNGRELLTEGARTVPLSLYASCKLAAEDVIMRKLTDKALIFRFGTLFGFSPRMRFDLVVNRFIGQAIQDRRIAVFGGNQLRPFLHVSTAAKMIKRALYSDAAGLYNLGGTNLTISEVANTVSRLSGCEVKVYEEIKDIRNYAIDSAKAEAAFGPLEGPGIEFAFREISEVYRKGEIKDYALRIYNNEEMLRGIR
jgi:nucleoside-diphosphate-sugar epimerase